MSTHNRQNLDGFRNIRRRCGSLSIFFCIVLTALVTVMGTWLQAVRIRSLEADIARGLSAEVQVGLAGFDRTLFEQFGLFGFREPTTDSDVFPDMVPALAGTCELSLKAERPLYNRPELQMQILRHMKARVPAVYLEVLASRLKQLADCLPDRKPDTLTPSSFRTACLPELNPGMQSLSSSDDASQVFSQSISVLDPVAVSEGDTGLASILRGIMPVLDQKMVRGLADSLFGDLVSQLEDKLLQTVRDQYRRYAADMLGIGQDKALTDLLGQMPDFLDPDSLSTLGKRVDQLMTFATVPVYDKFCLMEYGLGYFIPRVTIRSENGITGTLSTLDGRKMTDDLALRQGEIERLITGLDNTRAANLVVRMAIISMRSFIQLTALVLDETRMTALRTAAASLAAAIGVLSGGTVLFDPGLLTWVLAVGEALAAGYEDSQKLLDGKGVPVWPGKGNINLQCWYQDYLRLLLLILPQSLLLERMARILETIVPGPFFTALTAEITWRGRTARLSAAYFPDFAASSDAASASTSASAASASAAASG